MSQTQIFVDNEILNQLDATAIAQTQSREAALKEAIRNYVEYDRHIRAKIARGLEDIEAGRVSSMEDVDREAETLLAEILERDRHRI